VAAADSALPLLAETETVGAATDAVEVADNDAPDTAIVAGVGAVVVAVTVAVLPAPLVPLTTNAAPTVFQFVSVAVFVHSSVTDTVVEVELARVATANAPPVELALSLRSAGIVHPDAIVRYGAAAFEPVSQCRVKNVRSSTVGADASVSVSAPSVASDPFVTSPSTVPVSLSSSNTATLQTYALDPLTATRITSDAAVPVVEIKAANPVDHELGLPTFATRVHVRFCVVVSLTLIFADGSVLSPLVIRPTKTSSRFPVVGVIDAMSDDDPTYVSLRVAVAAITLHPSRYKQHLRNRPRYRTSLEYAATSAYHACRM
jgi:hypothetical protein